MNYLRYIRVVLIHKWFVLVAGLKCGVPLWRLLIHDWSKFTPSEIGPYKRRFFEGNAGDMDHSLDPQEFHRAFLHHVHCNPHHWEHWCKVEFCGEMQGQFAQAYPANGVAIPMEMPKHFVREMVADWWAAGRAYEKRWCLPAWYYRNRRKMVLQPSTRSYVEYLISRTADKFPDVQLPVSEEPL